MDLALKREIGDVPDLRHRVRQLRWFKTSFRHDAKLISERYGVDLSVDDRRLTEAFLNWAEVFAAQKAYASINRRDFVFFAAGLLLRELLRARPVSTQECVAGATTLPADPMSSIAQSWPEGFLYTNYCLCVLGAVLEQEGLPLDLAALADDLRTWLSYKENAREDPSAAIAFLDLFTGNEPNWWMPDSVLSRAAMKRAVAAARHAGRADAGAATQTTKELSLKQMYNGDPAFRAPDLASIGPRLMPPGR